MNDWGISSDVALFIGGPEDGVIKDIGRTRQIRAVESEPMHLYSFGSPTPVRTMMNYRYVNYERCQVSYDGQVYTVMADRQQNDLRDISDRVTEQVMYGSYPMRYAQGGILPSGYHTHWAYDQQYMVAMDMKVLQDWAAKISTAYDATIPPKKSPEEALAWLHEKKGKDFL